VVTIACEGRGGKKVKTGHMVLAKGNHLGLGKRARGIVTREIIEKDRKHKGAKKGNLNRSPQKYF